MAAVAAGQNQLLDMSSGESYGLTSDNWGSPCYFCDIYWSQGATYLNIDQQGVSAGYFSLSAPVTAFREYSFATGDVLLSVVGVSIPLTVLEWGNFYTGFSARLEVDWSALLAGNDDLSGSEGSDRLYGFAGDDRILGNGGNDSLFGGFGADHLSGGAGTNSLSGGQGDDTYVVTETGDVVTEGLDAGRDTVESAVTHALSANVENLTLTGSLAGDATGNGLANVLTGNAAANRLDGLGGADTLIGGDGDDTYRVAQAGDLVVELPDEGSDEVSSTISCVLLDNVEHLLLLGTAAIDGTGNDLGNRLTGNGGANRLVGGGGDDTLVGGSGADTLRGGSGNDTYVVDAGDRVTELADEGVDAVASAVGYSLGGALENLRLTGSAAIDGVGNALANVLLGNGAGNRLEGRAGNDSLNGGLGDDTLVGGLGNDTYTVDAPGDRVVEQAEGGTDRVRSQVAYTLADTLERLVLLGSAAIDGYGNSCSNALTGNAAANLLDGGAAADTLKGGGGADTLIGGRGNDTYYVDPLDTVIEEPSAGIDQVYAVDSYTLASQLENLTMIGALWWVRTALVGNERANVLIGSAYLNELVGGGGNDTLDGGGANGYDILVGGPGNDLYHQRSPYDEIVEAAGAGVDTVRSYAQVTFLAEDVENLTLVAGMGTSSFGNALDNVIAGNGHSNWIDGKGGNDTLSGAGGLDIFSFRSPLGPTNVDLVGDFDDIDRIELSLATFAGLSGGSTLDAAQFHAASGAAAGHDADDRIVYDTATGALYYDPDGSGDQAAVRFAVLGVSAHPALVAADFLLAAA